MVGGSAARIGLCCSVAAAASALVGGACGDGDGVGPRQQQALVHALCDKLVECGCSESLRVPVPLDCSGWSIAFEGTPQPYYGYEGYGYDEPEPSLTLDVDCLERYAEAIAHASCDGPPIQLPCEERCQPYFGPGLEGEPCATEYGCGRGLFCVGYYDAYGESHGECRNPCSIHGAREGERCDSIGCEPGLFCGATLDFEFPVCARPPSIGQPCDMGDCGPGARCDDSETCVRLSPIGEPCMGHRECESVYCPAGFCEARPIAGSPCGIDGVCSEGTTCVATPDAVGLCITAPALCESMFETASPFLFP